MAAMRGKLVYGKGVGMTIGDWVCSELTEKCPTVVTSPTASKSLATASIIGPPTLSRSNSEPHFAQGPCAW